MKVSRICAEVSVNLGTLYDFKEKVWIPLKPPELVVELYMKTPCRQIRIRRAQWGMSAYPGETG